MTVDALRMSVEKNSFIESTTGFSSSKQFPQCLTLKDLQLRKPDTSELEAVDLHTLDSIIGTTPKIFIHTGEGSKGILDWSVKKVGKWEADGIISVCRDWLSKYPGHFLDVGANIGTYTLPIAAFLTNSARKVFSVEGFPGNFNALAASTVENEFTNIALYPYAIGSKEGIAYMWSAGENQGANRVRSQEKSDTKLPVTVNVTTLDDMLQSNPAMKQILVAKVDIEGSEGSMMKGATVFFRQFPPCLLLIELQEALLRQNDSNLAEVLLFLGRSGYDVPLLKGVAQENLILKQKDLKGCIKRCS